MSDVKEHFDKIAAGYDSWKVRNYYYYRNLKKLFAEFIEPGKTVLDFGCGTGDVLADLKPQWGSGYDLSTEMVKLAQAKHSNKPNLYFTDVLQHPIIRNRVYDFIICADVIEHLENVREAVHDIQSLSSDGTKVIITMANPLWEPILFILEKLKMKMPEGPHQRVKIPELKEILRDEKFVIKQEGYRLLIPTKWFPGADFLNHKFSYWPLVKKLGLIWYIIVTSASHDRS